MSFHKLININIFTLVLAVTTIGFLNEFQFQSIGKVLTYISVILFLVIVFNKNFLNNYKFYGFIFFILFLILYLSSNNFGNLPSINFLKMFIQIFICFLVFIFFIINKIHINTDLIVVPVISIGSFLLFLLLIDKFSDNFFLYNFSFIFSESNISEFYKENLSSFSLNEFWIENNPYSILLNILLLNLLCKKKFNMKYLLQICIIIFLIFFSENTFSKITMFLLLSSFFLKENTPKFFLITLITLIFSIIFIISGIFFFYDNLIFVINFIYEVLFSNLMSEEFIKIEYGYLATSSNYNNLMTKVISILSFKSANYFQPLKDSYTFDPYNHNISHTYYNYYMGLIFRLSIIKLKILELVKGLDIYSFSNEIRLQLIGKDYMLTPKAYIFPDISNEFLMYLSVINSEQYLFDCKENFDFKNNIIDCGKNLLGSDALLNFDFHTYNMIGQNIQSTHNSWLSFAIISKKFIFLIIINFLLFLMYLIIYKKLEILFIIFNIFFIFLFEDYLFSNRYNLSLIFWLILSQIFLDLSIKKRIN